MSYSFYIGSDFYVLQQDEIMKGAMKAMGPKFRDTILALGGGKAPKEVKK